MGRLLIGSPTTLLGATGLGGGVDSPSRRGETTLGPDVLFVLLGLFDMVSFRLSRSVGWAALGDITDNGWP